MVPKEEVTYAVWQKEQCPDTGRTHFQFMVILKIRSRLTAVKKLFPGDHLEICRDAVKSRLYCMKQDTRLAGPWEMGALPQSKENIVSLVKRQRVLDVITENPSLWRNYQVLSLLRSRYQPVRSEPTQGVLLWGKSGTGKSKICNLIGQFLGKEDVYWQNGTKWWDGYDQQRLVVIDEFRGGMDIKDLLRLCDRYPLPLEVKGGFTQFNSPLVIFTSNLSFSEMYPFVNGETAAALFRRFLICKF